MTKNIKFINVGRVSEEYYPAPAKKEVPDWYKETKSTVEGSGSSIIGKYMMPGGGSPSTVKRCMPVFDAMTAGYIIKTHEDFVVDGEVGDPPFFYWKNDASPSISFQTKPQAEKYPNREFDIPKWHSHWAISTPPGYSCLIIDPMHRDSEIRILEAIVDTDTYAGVLGLPFLLKDPLWRGIVPAGTPIAQVIPYRRESFKLTVSDSNEDMLSVEKSRKLLKSVFIHGYKNKFWSRKEYN
jgi:hypothetical protein